MPTHDGAEEVGESSVWKGMVGQERVRWEVPQERGRPVRVRVERRGDLYDKYGPRDWQAVKELGLTPPEAYGRPGVPRRETDPQRWDPGDPNGDLRREVEASVGTDPLQDPQSWVTKVNPHHDYGGDQFQKNCPSVTMTVADIIQGRDVRLADGDFGKVPGDYDETMKWMGVRNPTERFDRHLPPTHPDPAAHLQAFTDKVYRSVADGLRGRPPRTVAAICVEWAPRPVGGGHWFVAYVDDHGAVRAIEAQPGANSKVMAWPPAYPTQLERLEYTVREPGGDWEDGGPAGPESKWA
ncbi:toxin glutamine deamidase domain-containing protein [Kribbella sp. NPDC026611]|uniref:toxin glutamine deamidase domain-containing protein n=1 Tax=Kribbella sp. NPDC026611 TaxID=3154911 RepID=UPI0033C0F26F